MQRPGTDSGCAGTRRARSWSGRLRHRHERASLLLYGATRARVAATVGSYGREVAYTADSNTSTRKLRALGTGVRLMLVSAPVNASTHIHSVGSLMAMPWLAMGDEGSLGGGRTRSLSPRLSHPPSSQIQIQQSYLGDRKKLKYTSEQTRMRNEINLEWGSFVYCRKNSESL
eukprot:3467000-Rhodomonas_salina.4